MLPAFILIRRNVVKQKMRRTFRLLTRPQEKRPELRCMKPDSPPCSPSLFANKHRTLSLTTIFARDPQHHYYGCLKFCSPFVHICSPGKLGEHRHREGGRDERRNRENEGERECRGEICISHKERGWRKSPGADVDLHIQQWAGWEGVRRC